VIPGAVARRFHAPVPSGTGGTVQDIESAVFVSPWRKPAHVHRRGTEESILAVPLS